MLQHTSLILPLPHDNRLPSSLTQTRLVDLEWSCRTNGEVQNDGRPVIRTSTMETLCESDRNKFCGCSRCLPLGSTRGFLGGFLSPTDVLYVAKLHIVSLPQSTEGYSVILQSNTRHAALELVLQNISQRSSARPHQSLF